MIVDKFFFRLIWLRLILFDVFVFILFILSINLVLWLFLVLYYMKVVFLFFIIVRGFVLFFYNEYVVIIGIY